MKTHTTNYYNTFIEAAEDCPLAKAEIPPQKGNEKTVAALQYEMIGLQPYQYTSDDVLFSVYAIRNNIEATPAERARFFSKGQACFRASPLCKRYGWGIHHNDSGKIALFAIETLQYQQLAADKNLKHTKALRGKK
jgi:hypothetical protein